MKFENGKIKIFLDIDNVIGDWTSHAVRTMGLDPFEPALRQRLESQETILNILDDTAMWSKIRHGGAEWWYNIPLFPWAKKLWNICNRLAPTAFLSTPWHGHGSAIMETAAAGKVKWIRKYFDTNDFFLGVHKQFCAAPNALLIDDSTSNCTSFREAGGFAFQWPSPLRMERENTWNQALLSLVEYIEKDVMPKDSSSWEMRRIRIIKAQIKSNMPNTFDIPSEILDAK